MSEGSLKVPLAELLELQVVDTETVKTSEKSGTRTMKGSNNASSDVGKKENDTMGTANTQNTTATSTADNTVTPAIDPLTLMLMQQQGQVNPMMLMMMLMGNQGPNPLLTQMQQQMVNQLVFDQKIQTIRAQAAKLAASGATQELVEAYTAQSLGVPCTYQVQAGTSDGVGGLELLGAAIGGAAVAVGVGVGGRFAGWW